MSLRDLSELPGVSGDEARVRDYIIQAIKPYVDEVWYDALGNVFARKGHNLAGPHVMLCAHMDEVGAIVTHIAADGTLHFDTVGGIDARVLPAVFVRIGADLVPGVIGTKPIHAKSNDERGKPINMDDLYIDIGAHSRAEAEALISLGDYVSFWTQYEQFHDHIAKGKAFDDRVGCHIIMELLKNPATTPITAAFTVQEEIGLRGAGVAAYTIQPDMALVVEGTTCADIPLSMPHGESTRLGEGPALTIADRSVIVHKDILDGLVRAGTIAQVPYQFKRTTFGGTDAGAIHISRSGIRTGVVSVPCRYIHTPAALLDLRDVQHTQKLIEVFLHRVVSGGTSHD